jgi:hypothetical protein
MMVTIILTAPSATGCRTASIRLHAAAMNDRIANPADLGSMLEARSIAFVGEAPLGNPCAALTSACGATG